MKVAALDLGTNSFLCLIAEVENGEIRQIFSDEVQIVRLGQEVALNKKFHPEALLRAKQCLQDFKRTIDLHQPEKILAMATSAARDVANSEELFEMGRSLKIPIEIIPGELEAQITFQGSISGFPKDQKRRAVIDIGGGSTEIIAGTDLQILGGASVDLGGVRLTEKFFQQQPPTEEKLMRAQSFVGEKLQSLLQTIRQFQVEELVAVAGTPTELAAASLGGFDAQKIDGFQLTAADLAIWLEKFEKTSPQERVSKFGISKGRADIILAGTLILQEVIRSLQFQQLTVSTRGVRYGVALELEKRK
ncbi:MAG: Ppx/GppA family phosphatase [Pseudobdellovibrionaceae bacterium]